MDPLLGPSGMLVVKMSRFHDADFIFYNIILKKKIIKSRSLIFTTSEPDEPSKGSILVKFLQVLSEFRSFIT